MSCPTLIGPRQHGRRRGCFEQRHRQEMPAGLFEREREIEQAEPQAAMLFGDRGAGPNRPP